MNQNLTLVCYGIILAAASLAWQFAPPSAHQRDFRPRMTLSAVMIIGIPSLAQLTVAPGLLTSLERNGFAGALLQPWRVVTSLLVQDGLWPGMLFNLAALAWIGILAESLWKPRQWLFIALGSGLGAQFWGYLVQPLGAGNSVIVFGLAASLLVRTWSSGKLTCRIAAAVGLSAVALLVLSKDIHGGAALLGALIAVLLLRLQSPKHIG
ncbi:hypothetical protein CQ018_12405 [Arthrobacter sp. MYb227]|uniref:rhomboid family intramembrane serine protease n=1 Tax=Arthrobacter sp. MYb227 TaxID=1848601 RepID=UPI000CFB916E|nr:rhomboid family intramembrane serine protease [Arthrobacter sp. MYb227]PQZ92299.1 hypothetical protein CQ018_12405 [Arthrobacter sp. MYb227]